MPGHVAWVGLDCGCSQLTMAMVGPDGKPIALEQTQEPSGDGHQRDVALARLMVLLGGFDRFKDYPVTLAGYCYEHSGVAEAFRQAGWTVVGTRALNDVVGWYGLTDMRGNAIIAGCGSYPQVVYADNGGNILWPGDDVATELPQWPLSGWSYAMHLKGLGLLPPDAVQDPDDHGFTRSGRLLGGLLGPGGIKAYMDSAAAAIATVRRTFERCTGTTEPPRIVLGGGAVADDSLWHPLEHCLNHHGIEAVRPVGNPAMGLVAYARLHPDTNAWGHTGSVRPGWL